MTQSDFVRRLVRLAGAINQKAAKLGLPGRLIADDLFAAYARSGGRCPYCGIGIEPMSCSFDHVIPLSRGGANAADNLAACCLTCQRVKFDKTESEFSFYRTLMSTCEVCGRQFKPRWSEWKAGRARICTRRCSARKRWAKVPA
jgi:HNH endonuclease